MVSHYEVSVRQGFLKVPLLGQCVDDNHFLLHQLGNHDMSMSVQFQDRVPAGAEGVAERVATQRCHGVTFVEVHSAGDEYGSTPFCDGHQNGRLLVAGRCGRKETRKVGKRKSGFDRPAVRDCLEAGSQHNRQRRHFGNCAANPIRRCLQVCIH